MKTWTCILAAGAILALAAPAGFSAIPQDPSSGYGHAAIKANTPAQKLVLVTQKSKSQAATIKALRAQVKALTAENKALGAANASLTLRVQELTPKRALDPTPRLECASTADPVQTIDYPDVYDWSC